MIQRYSGKKVVIIGGTSGIGLATARHLLDEGAKVLVTGRSSSSLQNAHRKISEAIIIRSDLSSLQEIHALAPRIQEEFGNIDLLFVNAGINASGPIEGVTEELYDEAFAVNAKGPFFTITAITPLIAAGGSIVITTSVANMKALPNTSIYAATKAALRSMVRAFARELLPRNIRVNAVSPGPIDTPVLERSLGEEQAKIARSHFREINPMQRIGTPGEVAHAVAFLGFEATYTTGAELPVDGGASQL